MKNVLIISLLVYCCCSFSQAQPPKTFSPNQLHQDLDSLVGYLEEIHPDLYGKYPRKKFHARLVQLKKKINRDLTLLEFYTIAAPLLALLQDGHIDFKIGETYASTNPFILPHRFKLTIQEPYIEYQGPLSTVTAALPAKARVIRINGIPARQIVSDVVSMVTGENEAFRADYGGERLAMFLELLYQCQGTYAIDYKLDGRVFHCTLTGIRKQELDRLTRHQTKPSAQPTCYHFRLVGDSTGVMELKCLEWGGLEAFLDSSFTRLHQRQINNLIIDLTDNGGGDSDVGDELLNYLLDHPYKQYDKILSKHSQFTKQLLLKQLNGKSPSAAQRALLTKANGTIDTLVLDKTTPPQDLALRYRGRLFVLVNQQTYSSAADFAQCIKHYGRGLIVGQETGGQIKSFGDIVPVTLPNTQLEVVISSKFYYNVGAQSGQWGGVVPDQVIRKHSVLPVVLQQIEDSLRE